MTSAEGVGFQSAKAGLQAVSAQTQWINQQVSAGKLALDPEVAEKAAKHCEDKARELTAVLADANAINSLNGLGSWPDGQQLTARFKSKATDENAGALALVREYQKELREQAKAFRSAAKDYRSTDEQIANDMQRGIQ
ncbi:hypothetical protein [Saccharopolyspora rosea]|uniref:PE domain-containing protein n=1 Tax=Saccharopolyspora rosea TaxID=524884 RepID=A0ABW3FPT0_9PSEU|nr:hypothetical protein [Saccharopolyspora rosea]